MKRILLIMLGLSSLIWAERFTRDAGVVTDNQTHLQWQDDYSDNADTIKTATWTAAIEYCETLGLDGGEWRLPNKKEMLSIVDYTAYNPSISSLFQKKSSNHYWSSTTDAYYTDSAWIVSFNYGYTNSYGKTYSNTVRCVRAGQ